MRKKLTRQILNQYVLPGKNSYLCMTKNATHIIKTFAKLCLFVLVILIYAAISTATARPAVAQPASCSKLDPFIPPTFTWTTYAGSFFTTGGAAVFPGGVVCTGPFNWSYSGLPAGFTAQVANACALWPAQCIAGDPNPDSAIAFKGTFATPGVYTWTTTATLSNGASQTATFVITVISPPSITLTAIPPSVRAGQTTTLDWITQNAASCTATNTPPYAPWPFKASYVSNGFHSTAVVAPPNVPITQYQLVCTGLPVSGGGGFAVTFADLFVPVLAASTSPPKVGPGTVNLFSSFIQIYPPFEVGRAVKIFGRIANARSPLGGGNGDWPTTTSPTTYSQFCVLSGPYSPADQAKCYKGISGLLGSPVLTPPIVNGTPLMLQPETDMWAPTAWTPTASGVYTVYLCADSVGNLANEIDETAEDNCYIHITVTVNSGPTPLATAAPTPTPAPMTITATCTNGKTIHITWTTYNGQTKYRVQVGPNPSRNPADGSLIDNSVFNGNVTGTTLDVPAPGPGTFYVVIQPEGQTTFLP